MTPQEESHRMTTIRKVYQKAILVPTSHVEQLWKDYDNFENSVSRTLVSRFSVWITNHYEKSRQHITPFINWQKDQSLVL